MPGPTDNIEDIYELSPMQEGMLFHTLQAPGAGVYVEQLVCTIGGAVDARLLVRAWQAVVDRHPVLRTAFVWEGLEKPMQAVRRTAAVASRVLFVFFVAWLLLMDVPQAFSDSVTQFTWAAAETSVMLAAAWILFVRLNGDRDVQQLDVAGGDKGLRVARALYGVTLIHFGIAHFTFLQRTTSMVPSWLPWHVAWAYFFGCTFIAAGMALIIGVQARLAAALSAVQLGMFTVLVWIPVVTAAPSASDWTEFVASYALTAGAWVVAESYRGLPWLAVGKR